MRISDWSSDVCSSDLWTSSVEYWGMAVKLGLTYSTTPSQLTSRNALALCSTARWNRCRALVAVRRLWLLMTWANWSASSPAKAISSECQARVTPICSRHSTPTTRSEEHKSELQSLKSIPNAVYRLK